MGHCKKKIFKRGKVTARRIIGRNEIRRTIYGTERIEEGRYENTDRRLQREYVESGKKIEEWGQREESVWLGGEVEEQSLSETELVRLVKFRNNCKERWNEAWDERTNGMKGEERNYLYVRKCGKESEKIGTLENMKLENIRKIGSMGNVENMNLANITENWKYGKFEKCEIENIDNVKDGNRNKRRSMVVVMGGGG